MKNRIVNFFLSILNNVPFEGASNELRAKLYQIKIDLIPIHDAFEIRHNILAILNGGIEKRNQNGVVYIEMGGIPEKRNHTDEDYSKILNDYQINKSKYIKQLHDLLNEISDFQTSVKFTKNEQEYLKKMIPNLEMDEVLKFFNN